MELDELLGHLQSGDYDRISRGLIYVQKGLQERPPPRLREKLLALCDDSDPDIRSDAIQAVGYYWQMSESFPILARILTRADEDELVLNSALYAVAEMSRNKPDLKKVGLASLARAALDEHMSKGTREEAYALALWVDGQISSDSFAKMGQASDIDIDKDYLSSLRTK
jgi:hypothetical protein